MQEGPFYQQIETMRQRMDALLQESTAFPAMQRALLPVAMEELSTALEELQVAGEELHQQNEELVATRQMAEVERQRYQELFDFAPDGYIVTDAGGTIQEANRAAAVLLRVPQDFLVDKPLIVFVAREEHKAFHNQLTRLQQGDVEKTQNWEMRMQPRDAAPFPADLTVAPVRDAEGNVVGLRWLVRDVTERKWMESALRESESRMLTILENCPSMVFLKDLQGHYLYANPVFEAISHRPSAEVVGKTDVELFPLEQAAAFRANDLKVLEACVPMEFEEVALHDEGPHTSIVTKFPLFNTQGEMTAICGIVTDITDRKRAEEEIKKRGQQLAEAQQIAHVGSWEWDVSKNVVAWSDELYRIYGFEPQAFSVTYEAFLERVHPDDRERTMQAVEAAYRTQQPFSFYERIVRPDGEVRMLYSRGDVVVDESGQPVKMLGTCHDVTESRRKGGEKFREFLDCLTDGVFVIKQDGHIQWLNAQAERLFGYQRDELVGQNVEALLPEPLRERHAAHRAGFLTDPRPRPMGIGLDLAARRKDGSEFPVEISLSPIASEEGQFIIAIVSDVTERRQAEQRIQNLNVRLQRQVEEFQALIMTAPVGIAIAADPECNYIWGNPEFAHMLGTSVDQNISKSGPGGEELPFKVLRNGQEIPAEDLPMQRACREGRDVLDEELDIAWTDGTFIHELCRATPLRDEWGGVRGCIGVFLDITERKRAEDVLRQARDELEIRVQERTAQLSRANEVLRVEITQRQQAEQRLHLRHSATRALSESVTLSEAVSRILQIVCETLGWDWGELWAIDRQADALRCVETYHLPSVEFPQFEAQTRQITIPPGEGLPGRVWASGKALWVPNILNNSILRRKAVAAEEGLRSALAFPIILRNEVLGVMAFLSREARQPEGNLLEIFADLGSQMGQFMERKWAEDALQKSEAMFRGLFEFAPDAVVVINEEGRITRANAQMEAMFGYSREELFSKPVEILMPEHYRGQHEGHRTRYMADPRARPMGACLDLQGRRKDGSGFPVDVLLSPLETSEGSLVIAVIRDVTERKRAEEELKRSRQQLRNLALRLEAAREEERARVAREIHDQLGQALTALQMDVAYLDRRLPPGEQALHEKTETMSNLIDHTIRTMQSLVTSLRPPLLDNFGLTAAVEWEVQQFQARAGIRCALDVSPPELTVAPARATTVFRILQEALTNVARHAHATEVSVELKETAEHLTLEVKDNGKGVTAEQLTHPQSIGLLGMRERALSCGGEVTINGAPGEGTTVVMRMPL